MKYTPCKYCSPECSRKAMWAGNIKKPDAVCPICGKEYKSRSGYLKYCSIECSIKGRSINVSGNKHFRWKGGKESQRFRNYIYSAKSRNYEFSISSDHFDFFCKEPCFYCGKKSNKMGLDRYDNSKGYIIGNVVPCCEICNRMKLNYSFDNFISHIKNIVSIWGR